MLLARANQKPIAGWGSWGRNRVYDPETGRDLSVTDGLWVITIGSYGWFGYLAQFGLLTAPVLVLLRRRDHSLTPATTGLAILTAAALIDLIPNATLTPVTWVVAGSLAGLAVRATQPWIEAPTATVVHDSTPWGTVGINGPMSPLHRTRPFSPKLANMPRHQRKSRR